MVCWRSGRRKVVASVCWIFAGLVCRKAHSEEGHLLPHRTVPVPLGRGYNALGLTFTSKGAGWVYGSDVRLRDCKHISGMHLPTWLGRILQHWMSTSSCLCFATQLRGRWEDASCPQPDALWLAIMSPGLVHWRVPWFSLKFRYWEHLNLNYSACLVSFNVCHSDKEPSF